MYFGCTEMTNIFEKEGEIFIFPQKKYQNVRIKNNTRFSLKREDKYVSIIEIKLPENTFLVNGRRHHIVFRVISDENPIKGIKYSVMNPVNIIGFFEFH
mgnify:CR=1 FL=1